MLKSFHFRRRLIAAAILLLTGGVVLEEWHRAHASRHHHPPADLTSPAVDPVGEFSMTNANYEARVDLWANPGVPVYDTDISYANYVFQSAIHPEDFTRLATRSDHGENFTFPVTMTGNHIDYAHISIGNFKANLTLTPFKAKPEDLIPTQLKPGLGGSFDF
ncbi:MAG TPA: hypothetical protein VNN22_08925 [Verrucomicrobiae bacterium]|nr:hypothetical protein [Verrucomicrobiae bacterium]